MAFLILTDPSDMRWLAASEAEYWGFTRRPVQDAPALRPVPVQAAARR